MIESVCFIKVEKMDSKPLLLYVFIKESTLLSYHFLLREDFLLLTVL